MILNMTNGKCVAENAFHAVSFFHRLRGLVGRKFDNPYKYNDAKEAFTDAVNKLKELLP